jgi:ArsR family transcriptional regulator
MDQPKVLLIRLKALADQTRLRIIALLTGNERCVCELRDQLDVPQPLLSFHLKTLRNAGIITDRRDGRWVHYSLQPHVLAEVEEYLRMLRTAPSETPELAGAGRPRC